MDPPPLPLLHTATAAAAAAATTTVNATAMQVNYPDSVDSSPRSRNADTACWLDEPLPPVPGAKLRFMCSFGGHIIPRPHDKSLCYVGGETRIVVVDRYSYLSDLSSRLSHTLLNGRPFTLKYQLPHEDLDSLISVSTDEDLENMIEEYDRTTSDTNLKPTSRLRLFLFFSKPETAASMGALLDDSKSETWFVDALNHAGLLPRRVSDSATGCILNLDQDLEAQAADSLSDNNKQVRSNVHDVHSMPDSMVENNSSYGSSSSSPSMSNLPPIRVRVEDQKVGMEEQFAQISLAPTGLKQDDTFGVLSAPPPLPTVLASAITVASTGIPTAVSNETMNRIFSDDERSDQGVPVGFRKPPLPLQPVHMKAGGGGGNYSLHSPESVASDCSIASANSVSKAVYYQEQVHAAHRDNRANNSPNTNNENPDSNSRTQQQQVQDSGYMYPPQMDQQQQQQFLHASSHYMQAPMSSYYQMYAPSSQQQQLHHPTDQQYAMYVMPSVAQQAQSYNMSMQSNIPDQTSPHPANVAASGAYKDAIPPIYQTKTTAPAKPEMASGIYGTAVASNQQFVQLPSMQFQQQYAGFHPSQSIAVASSATGNYGYEYTNHPNDHQVYYTHQAAPLPPQYQTMTAAAVMALSDPSKQLPTESLQQIRTAQPP